MSHPNDTQRMRPAEATDPSTPHERTDPGGATAPKPATTQPIPIPITAVSATPEARPLVDRRNATDPDIDPLLKAFDRTPVPPAPLPDERASSDGGDFVAHYAVTKPAARNDARPQDARVVVQRELRQLISEPSADADREGALVAPCEVTTEIPIARQRRRRRGAMIVVGISLVAAVILIGAAVANRPSTPNLPIVAATASSNAPASTPSAVVTLSVAPMPTAPASATTPPSAATTAPSSAALPVAQPSTAPPRPTARPVQSPKPQKPDDELEYVLPR